MHVHSTLPCIDSGTLCIHPYYGLTMTTSYRMHYYNQYHQQTPFCTPIFTWYEVSYLDQSMESVISNSYLHGSYLHPWHDHFSWSFAGNCSIFSPTIVMDLLPYPFLQRVADHTPSASATYSARSMSSLVCPLMPTSKQWLSLVVYYKYIISNILIHHAIFYACNTYPHVFQA